MAKKGSRTKRQLPRSVPTSYIIHAISTEQDRGCVLVGCAYLDYALELLLRAVFESKDSPNQELINKVLNPHDNRAFLFGGWPKCVVARLISAIPEEIYQALELVRSLRNDFAHTPGTVELSQAAVASIVKVLVSNGHQDWFEPSPAPKHLWKNLVEHGYGPFSESRLLFMSACVKLWVELICRVCDAGGSAPDSEGGAILSAAFLHMPDDAGPSLDHA
jgi:hypothetical protein